MADNLSISVTADTSSLRAQLTLAQADLRAFQSQVRQTATQLRSAGEDAKAGLMAQLQRQSGELNAAAAAVRQYGNELKAALKPEGLEKFSLAAMAGERAFDMLKEAAGGFFAALSVEKIVEWSLETAEAGERTVNMAAAVGSTTQRFSELSGAMRLAGGDADSAVRAFQILAQHAEGALQNPMSKASQAFDTLGLKAHDLQEGLRDPTTLIDRLAEGFQRLQEAGRGGEAVVALRELAGRGNFSLIAAIREGGEGLQKLKAEARESGAVIDEALGHKMTETAEKAHEVGLAFQGLKNTIYENLKEPLDESLTILKEFLQNLSGAKKMSEERRAELWPKEWGPYDPEKRLVSGIVPPVSRWFAGPPAPVSIAGPIGDYGVHTEPQLARGGAGLQPQFGSDLSRMIADAASQGITIGIGSGFRTADRQAQLFAKAVEKYGSEAVARLYVAPPGHSMHNLGLAGDLVDASGRKIRRGSPEDLYLSTHIGEFGLTRPMSYEPWHVEQAGAREGTAASEAGGPQRTLQDMQKALEAQWAAAKSEATRQMDDAKRRMLAGDGDADQVYQAALARWKAVVDQQTAYAKLGHDEQIAYVKSHAPAKTADVKALNELDHMREQQQRLKEELASRDIARIEKEVAARERANQDIVRGFEAQQAARVRLRELTPQQAFGLDIEAVTLATLATKERLDKILSSPTATPDQRTTAYWQEWDLGTRMDGQIEQLKTKIVAAGQEAADKFAAPFRQAFDRIGGSFESAVTGLITGSTTTQRIGQQLFQSVVSSSVSLIGGAASRAAAGPLAGLLGTQAKPGEGVGDVLGNAAGNWIGKQLGLGDLFSGGGQVANTTALAANTSAVLGLTAALGVSAGASVTGGAESLVGGAAVGGGAAAAGGGGLFSWLGGLLAFSRGGIVPSAAGGWVVPNSAGGIPALLHAREMVLPADISQGMQGMIASGRTNGGGDGDTHLHFHGPADGPAIERFFSPILKRALPGLVRGAFRSNALTPRTI